MREEVKSNFAVEKKEKKEHVDLFLLNCSTLVSTDTYSGTSGTLGTRNILFFQTDADHCKP